MSMSEPVLSVSDALSFINQTLEIAYPSLTIVGELANFKVSKDRWVYADLKDESAKMRLFGTVYQLPGPIEDGMMMEITGEPRLHPQFGFSFQIRSMRPVGEGTIKKASMLLRAKLEKEGLFSSERKRPIPYPPERVALITADSSAAYADFMKIAHTRWPKLAIDVHNTAVQGQDAVSELVTAIEKVNKMSVQPDVIVLVRGGGSSDDLSAYSSEQVVRAIAASRVPTLVAIGHETDESLAELTSDMRASTPSNAAELLVPDLVNEWQTIEQYKKLFERIIEDELMSRKEELSVLRGDLREYAEKHIIDERLYLEKSISRLDSYHPKHVLKRGYALVRKDGELLKGKVEKNDNIEIELQHVIINTVVHATRKK